MNNFYRFELDRWQKGKLILLASLSCWIIFTLPLGFIQPPATSCMVKENSTSFLKASSPGQKIVKRSIDLDECYHAPTEDEYLEVAANVVFERLRRSTDDNEIDGQPNSDVIEQNEVKKYNNFDDNNNGEARKVYDLENNRVRKRRAASNEENTSSGDLRYEQLVFEDDTSDPNAKIIDFEALQRKNRPADVLEYKRFLKVSNVAPFS